VTGVGSRSSCSPDRNRQTGQIGVSNYIKAEHKLVCPTGGIGHNRPEPSTQFKTIVTVLESSFARRCRADRLHPSHPLRVRSAGFL
jgi:hypothetical protein